jgi:hypothetical protein
MISRRVIRGLAPSRALVVDIVVVEVTDGSRRRTNVVTDASMGDAVEQADGRIRLALPPRSARLLKADS